MTYTDFAREARKMAAMAGGATRIAERSARDAAANYQRAASHRRTARRLSGQPEQWWPQAGYTPWDLERTARVVERLADTQLRHSFSATSNAAIYRGIAARYRESAASRATWEAEHGEPYLLSNGQTPDEAYRDEKAGQYDA